MNRTFFLLLLLVSFMNAVSQNIIVVDSFSKSPLSFVAIKYDKSGFYTSHNGQFSLNTINSDSIEISLLGYKKLKLKTINIKDTIFLKNEIHQLEEVVLSGKPKAVKKIKLSKKSKNFSSWPLQTESEILTSIYPSNEITDFYIDKIYIQFEKVIENNELKNTDIRAYVRLHIYNIENEKPSNSIYSSPPILINSFDRDKATFDISNQLISLKENGIFVGLELIGYYSNELKKVNTNPVVRPGFTEKTNKDFESDTFIRYIFKDQAKLIPVNKILAKGMPKNKKIERNFNIGFELWN